MVMNTIIPIDQQIVQWFLNLFGGNGWGTLILAICCLLLAVLCSGMIGFEREYHGHAAGLRTHILVAVGSALIMLVSIYGFGGGDPAQFANRDPARLAAQVITGIGFLGAGTIIQTGSDVKGLTTATTLWIVMAIGLAAGSGNFIICIVATLLAFFALAGMRKIEKRASKRFPILTIVVALDQPVLKQVLEIAQRYNVKIRDFESQLIILNESQAMRINMRCIVDSKNLALGAFISDVKNNVKPIDFKVSSNYSNDM